MIQANGLTKVYRRGGRPALLEVSLDARPGAVTVLLGPEDAGKTTALRLMLGLEHGQGVTLFNGRAYRQLRRPEREVGVVLPTVHRSLGHPNRTALGHLRMLAAAVGVPAARADALLEQTRLAAMADHRLKSFSLGMNRRLALATALLGDPGMLLLDAPAEDLSPRNAEWLHAFLRAFPAGGGSVLVTTRSPQEAALLGDRVITLNQGRVVADQPVAEFRRTRLHPEVAVRGPQMARLTDLLLAQGAEIRPDGRAGIAVSGLERTEIGELAYRNGILLHELADRVVEQPAPRASQSAVTRTPAPPAVQLLPAGVGARPRTLRVLGVSQPGRGLPGPATEVTPTPKPADGPPTVVLPIDLGDSPTALLDVGPAPIAGPVPAAAAVPGPGMPPGSATQPPQTGADLIPEPLTGPDHWNG
ncbi:ATP-binding cassette domain-containing protein [Kitasatospora sp. NPDC052896]|uniref:ATP-binding cassette domain-containing protein n=1 Tax=Kitasatospora sp. NPDC052896 TaxID=3364061 RepID=UPI0037C91833